jgi:ABC-type transport system involved in multi-copper enzyme maturation permease subunit
MKTLLRPTFAIARVTFQEIILDKVLYNLLVFAFLLIGVSYLAAQLTFIGQDRVVLDFGLTAISFSCGIIGVFQGASMLAKEFERRTIFVALARPISRGQFIVGKFLGLIGVVTLNWFLLSAIEIVLYLSLGGEPGPTVYYALGFLLLQSIMLSAFAVFFSSFTTTSISVMLVIGIYLIGTNVEPLRQVIAKRPDDWLKPVLSSAAGLIPNLGHFNLGFLVTYGLEPEKGFIPTGIVYALVWILPLIFVTGKLLDRREG